MTLTVPTPHKRVSVTLYRRKTGGPYYARFWWKGRQFALCTDAHSEAKAKQAAFALVEKQAGRTGESLKIGDAIKECLDARWPTVEDQQNAHYKTTKTQLETFAKEFPDLDLGDMTFEDVTRLVQKYLDTRRKKDAPRTILHRQRKLSRFFGWLIQRRRVPWQANPAAMRFIEIPAIIQKHRPPVRIPHLKMLVEASRETSIWPAVALCVTTGMRSIGTLRIRWKDLRPAEKTLRVFEKRRERIIPVTQWLVDALLEWRTAHPGDDESLILPIKPATLHARVAAIRKAHKLPPEVTLQGCRRTFISICMNGGISAELVASIAGNSVAVIERHYLDLGTMNARPVADLMETVAKTVAGIRFSGGDEKLQCVDN